MRTGRFSLWSAVAVLSLAASSAFEQAAHAQYTTVSLSLGSNYNSFNYSLGGVAGTGGGPISPSSLGGVPLAYVYCIDIPDDVPVGTTYANNSVTTTGKAVYGSPTINTWANGTNLVNVPNASAIAYLLGTYGLGATTAVQQDALQAAIWTEIYGASFQVTAAGQSAIISQMNTYLAGVGSGNVANFLWFSPNGVGNTPSLRSAHLAARGSFSMVCVAARPSAPEPDP
jgi:hypothetical protein